MKNHTPILSIEHKNLILRKTFERGCQNIEKDFFKCHLKEIFLSFFIFDYEFIANFLNSSGEMENIINNLLEKSSIFKIQYDKKVKRNLTIIKLNF